MNADKSYILSPSAGGNTYKPRVWVQKQHQKTDVGQFLSSCSIWRGPDKVTGTWIAYECRQEKLDKAVEYLISQGFQETHIDPYDGRCE